MFKIVCKENKLKMLRYIKLKIGCYEHVRLKSHLVSYILCVREHVTIVWRQRREIWYYTLYISIRWDERNCTRLPLNSNQLESHFFILISLYFSSAMSTIGGVTIIFRSIITSHNPLFILKVVFFASILKVHLVSLVFLQSWSYF